MMNRNNNVNKKYKRQWDCARGGGSPRQQSPAVRQGKAVVLRHDQLVPRTICFPYSYVTLPSPPSLPFILFMRKELQGPAQVVHGWPRPLSLVLSSSRVMHDGSVVMDSVVLTPPEFWVCLTSVLCE